MGSRIPKRTRPKRVILGPGYFSHTHTHLECKETRKDSENCNKKCFLNSQVCYMKKDKEPANLEQRSKKGDRENFMQRDQRKTERTQEAKKRNMLEREKEVQLSSQVWICERVWGKKWWRQRVSTTWEKDWIKVNEETRLSKLSSGPGSYKWVNTNK